MQKSLLGTAGWSIAETPERGRRLDERLAAIAVHYAAMRLWSSWVAPVIVTAAAASALAGCGSDKATIGTFAGVWQAHGRTLAVGAGGDAKESITLGLGARTSRCGSRSRRREGHRTTRQRQQR